MTQVDEPALREGLPLKRERWASYLDWAVRSFRLATVVARPETQVSILKIISIRASGPAPTLHAASIVRNLTLHSLDAHWMLHWL